MPDQSYRDYTILPVGALPPEYPAAAQQYL